MPREAKVGGSGLVIGTWVTSSTFGDNDILLRLFSNALFCRSILAILFVLLLLVMVVRGGKSIMSGIWISL